ncbi:MAG: hypothetical protein U0163_11600 [Gemmatimonadaceae bacterium]
MIYVSTDSATLVVNVLDVEEYLRGVVPREIGAVPPTMRLRSRRRPWFARSFAFERMNGNAARPMT